LIFIYFKKNHFSFQNLLAQIFGRKFLLAQIFGRKKKGGGP